MIKPILFNTAMVKAIVAGDKTTTRRICKDGNMLSIPDMNYYDAYRRTYAVHNYSDGEHTAQLSVAERNCPICPKDILYVRETWLKADDGYYYRADETSYSRRMREDYGYKWRPSIHMPKEAARLFLRVKDVRVERLQSIDDEGAKTEGANVGVGWEEKMRRTAIERFAEIWDSTIKSANMPFYSWEANPWVWVIEFERCLPDLIEGA